MRRGTGWVRPVSRLYGRCRGRNRGATSGSWLSQVPPRDPDVSRDFEFLLLADTGDISVAKEFEEITEVKFEVVQILALGPMIRVVVQIAKVVAIGLAPVGYPRFREV